MARVYALVTPDPGRLGMGGIGTIPMNTHPSRTGGDASHGGSARSDRMAVQKGPGKRPRGYSLGGSFAPRPLLGFLRERRSRRDVRQGTARWKPSGTPSFRYGRIVRARSIGLAEQRCQTMSATRRTMRPMRIRAQCAFIWRPHDVNRLVQVDAWANSASVRSPRRIGTTGQEVRGDYSNLLGVLSGLGGAES